MKTAEEIRVNPFSLVVNLPESKEKSFTNVSKQSKENQKDCSMQTYRIEVLTEEGKCLHYSLRASSKSEARMLSHNFIASMVYAYKDERLAYRLAGDNTYKFFGAEAEKKSLWRKVVDYFFVIEDEQYN